MFPVHFVADGLIKTLHDDIMTPLMQCKKDTIMELEHCIVQHDGLCHCCSVNNKIKSSIVKQTWYQLICNIIRQICLAVQILSLAMAHAGHIGVTYVAGKLKFWAKITIHLQTNGAYPVILHLDIDLRFQGQEFGNFLSNGAATANVTNRFVVSRRTPTMELLLFYLTRRCKTMKTQIF